MSLYEDIQGYQPYNEQEEKDRTEMLRLLSSDEELFLRTNTSRHFTGTCWVVSKDRTQVLMAYHKIYDSWAWLGGHADGDHDLRRVAYKELLEESGLKEARLVSPEIYSLEILTVDGHEKQGAYVSSHLHLNITYLFEADASLPLVVQPDENTAVKWFKKEEALKASTEPWFVARIYTKLLARMEEDKWN